MATDINSMKKEVERIKKRLTNKARSKGIWEHFGQKEARYLNDKYQVTCWDQDKAQVLLAFEEWIENFSLSDL